MPATRRTRGGGSKVMKDGKWTGNWRVVATISGRRRAFYGRSQSEAQRKATDASGTFVPVQQSTLGAYLLEWCDTQDITKKPQTAVNYRGNMVKHVIPVLGSLQLSEVTERDIDRLHSVMAAGGVLSGTSRRHIHTVLGTALAAARKRGLIEVNPVKNVESPKTDTAESTPLTIDDVRKFLSVAAGTKYEALWKLSLNTGLRPGEAMALTWGDIQGDQLSIRGSAATMLDGTRAVGPTKTRRSRRTITLNSVVLDALAKYRPADAQPSDIIFPGANGRVMSAGNIQRRWLRPLLKAAGFDDTVNMYSFRHTFATNALNAGVPIHVVSAMMGHASADITLRVYAHYLSGNDGDASRLIGALYV
jgi:integrase